MKERNKYLESDGLFWQSDTHEWFHDKGLTEYAQTDNGLHKDALPWCQCFVVRDKETGRYSRVMMDRDTNEIVYDTDSLEEMGFKIDQEKILVRFKD